MKFGKHEVTMPVDIEFSKHALGWFNLADWNETFCPWTQTEDYCNIFVIFKTLRFRLQARTSRKQNNLLQSHEERGENKKISVILSVI